MRTRYLFPLPQRNPPGDIGNKAESLNRLLLDGFPVPATWICSKEAFLEFKQRGVGFCQVLRSELEVCLDPELSYAVRSSGTLEDSQESSYAGQFRSVLDVRGFDHLLDAIVEVWQSATDPKIQSHQASLSNLIQYPDMNVLIQEMVQPQISGVSFSINPITGMDEVIIEAVPGSGVALVQDGVTPWRWVRKWDSWLERPDQADVGEDLVEEICQLTQKIAANRECPVDLEWVYDGSSIYLVQAREVTALDIPLYSNHISREVFPGLIKPLIWSVNTPLVNGAWIRLLTELIGRNDIQPEDLSRSFFNRAYFNMGTIGDIMQLLGFPRETLELLMGLDLEGTQKPSFKPSLKTLTLLPRMLLFILGKIGFGFRVQRHARRAWASYTAVRELDLSKWTDTAILDHIQNHFQAVQETAYYNIIAPLMMQLFNLILDRRLEKAGIDPRTLDFGIGESGVDPYDPYSHLQRLYDLYAELITDDQARMNLGSSQLLERLPESDEFRSALDQFLDHFGHLSDSGNDFSRVPWRENPDLVLHMVTHHNWPERTRQGEQFEDLDLTPCKRWLLAASYHRARRFQILREQIGASYTLGYGLFRNAFLELADRLVRQGILAERDDVMFLTWSEIETAVTKPLLATDNRELVSKRKAELAASRHVTPPATIYGETPQLPRMNSLDLLEGTATSRGCYTGPARVVSGLDDMHLVQEGDVLVVPYSDVSWTPLFAKAGAVVAEAGGILSHSSIIAREYGIPAVVAVQDACLKLAHTRVTVDGNQGQVILHRDNPAPDSGV